MNRALRAAAIGVLLIAPVALSACSSGQVNQTTGQVRDIHGATARVGDITVRDVELDYPQDGRYKAGDDAVLEGAIVNDGASADTLVSLSGDGFTGVSVTGTGAQASATTGSTSSSAAATTTSAATSSAAATTTGTSSSPATTTTPTTTPTTTTATLPSGAPSTTVGLQIPAHSVIFLGRNAPHITLTGLTRSIDAAQVLRLTFTFQNAGALTVDVPVAAPDTPVTKTSTYPWQEVTESSEPSSNAGSNG